MKKLALIVILGCTFYTGCSPYNVDDSKPGEPVDSVTNLDYSVSGEKVNLTWQLPSAYPDDIIQPVSVFIKIQIDGQDIGTMEIEDAPSSYVYSPYDSSKEYKFIVKVKGDVDTSDPNVSHLRYSLGNTVKVAQ